jgi:dephospho-CoA kinase
MLKIGLTGGIGSGKTTVAQIFQVLAIPVYYADDAAKELMNRDPDLKERIISAFGYQSYKEGKLDRAYLGNLVFDNEVKLDLLNSIVHPVTIRDAEEWMEKQHSPYAIKEAAIIFETGLEKYFDYVIGVTAPEALRIQRVTERDHSTKETVLLRIQQQMDEKEKMDRCDFVVLNDGIKPILPQVLAVHASLMAKANMGVTTLPY